MIRAFILFAFLAASIAGDCVWNRDTDFSTYPSLLMDTASWRSIIPVMEGDQRTIRIAAGSSVVVACPESTINATQTEVADAVCEAGTVLNVGGTNYNMMELGCVSRAKETISKYVDSVGTCTGDEHSIGYDVTGYPFYELIHICFDPVEENVLVESHTLRGGSVAASDGNPSRPSFKVDSGFFTVSANTCYEQASQAQLMEDILGDSSVIDTSNQLYFARGHMAPDADFLTEMESDATYYYINCVPQWQSFNNGNWKYLETVTRELASSRGYDLDIYSGPYRTLALNDTSGNPVDIFLGLTQDEYVIPAPDVTWKVIYDPVQNNGLAVVGTNNPYLTDPPSTICSDICSDISWIDFDVTSIYAGFTYCCTVQDLQSVVPNAPDLGNAGILSS